MKTKAKIQKAKEAEREAVKYLFIILLLFISLPFWFESKEEGASIFIKLYSVSSGTFIYSFVFIRFIKILSNNK